MKKIVLILSAALLLAACGEKQENKKMKPQVSKEEQAAAMQEVQAFIRDAGVYFIATEDGVLAGKNRAFFSFIFNIRLNGAFCPSRRGLPLRSFS